MVTIKLGIKMAAHIYRLPQCSSVYCN